jgi:uncharacterized protein (DUF111 family)
VVCLETQLDDATGEEIAHLVQRLLDAGALDAFAAPITMKKGRPGSLLTVIARPEREQELLALVLLESPTAGVRRGLQWRRELERRLGVVQTPFGPIEVKWVRRGETWHGKPEFEACRAAAERAGVTLAEVRRAAERAAERPARADEAPGG